MRDSNDIQIKAGHSGHEGPPFGKDVWILKRHDEKVWGPFESRHDVIGHYTELKHQNKWEWFEAQNIPIGTFRFNDWVVVDS